jgi:trigger factor
MKKEFTIEVKGKDWEEALDKAFQKAVKNVKIDGFRKGKAPKEIFLKKYGKESLYLDAADIVLPDAYSKMLEEHKDEELVAQPDITLKSIDDKKVVFNFILTTRPEVKLGKYKGLKVKKEKVEATEDEINATIEQMRSRYAEVMPKENGTVEDGDTAIIDFEGFRNGKAFDGGKGENYSLKIGSHTFIPGFEEQLIGMKTGEEKEIEVTFPKDYHSDELKGKKATFKVKVNDIKTTVIPEIGEEFFEDLGMEGVNSLETLKEEIKTHILARKEVDSENKFIDDLLDKVCEGLKVEIPEVMTEEEVSRILRQYEENLKMQGLTLQQFYQFTNSDEATLREQMKEEANKRILARFALEEIAKAENIEVTDEDALKEAEELAKKYQMKVEDFKKEFGGIEMVKYDMKMRKAIDVLKENN